MLIHKMWIICLFFFFEPFPKLLRWFMPFLAIILIWGPFRGKNFKKILKKSPFLPSAFSKFIIFI